MLNKIDRNIYESDNGYVVEFQKVDGVKAALVGKRQEEEDVKLLFIVSAEGMTRTKFLKHLEDNFDAYLEKYVG